MPQVSSGATADIGKDSTNMLVWLMLAQAQECVHIKAVNDNKSPGILAKLAKQVLHTHTHIGFWWLILANPLQLHILCLHTKPSLIHR